LTPSFFFRYADVRVFPSFGFHYSLQLPINIVFQAYFHCLGTT
jgi:hypothetical protein